MTRLLIAAIALATTVVLAAPVAAAPYCSSTDSSWAIGLDLADDEFESEQERVDYAQMYLRQAGVNATRVEFWNGCLRAWVRGADGTQTMQFFDPATYRRLG